MGIGQSIVFFFLCFVLLSLRHLLSEGRSPFSRQDNETHVFTASYTLITAFLVTIEGRHEVVEKSVILCLTKEVHTNETYGGE